jgi:hypothetical protein
MCDQTTADDAQGACRQVYGTMIKSIRARIELTHNVPGIVVGDTAKMPDGEFLAGYVSALMDVLDEVAVLSAQHAEIDGN